MLDKDVALADTPQ